MKPVRAILTFLGLTATTVRSQCMNDDPCPDVIALKSSNCTDYHIFVARGTDSQYPGHLGPLVKLVCDGLKNSGSCSYEDIIYPAKNYFLSNDSWCASAAEGVVNGQAQLADYAKRCPAPKSKLILLGFSQGASVALDMLGGGGGVKVKWPRNACVQKTNTALNRTTAPAANIVAVSVFGTVSRTANQSYDVKEGKPYNGTGFRTQNQLAGLDPYANAGILRNYCNKLDFICAPDSEGSNLKNHLTYFDLYNDEASQWIIKTAKQSAAKSSTAASKTVVAAPIALATSFATGFSAYRFQMLSMLIAAFVVSYFIIQRLRARLKLRTVPK